MDHVMDHIINYTMNGPAFRGRAVVNACMDKALWLAGFFPGCFFLGT